MSNFAPAPQTKLTVDPRAFDQDYEYGRPVTYGAWVPALILGAQLHTKRGTNSQSVHLIIGVVSSLPHPVTGKKCGCKIDKYVPTAGERYRDLIAAVEPDLVTKGGQIDLSKWAGRKVLVLLEEEVDKLQTQRAGVETKRAQVAGLRSPAAPPPPPQPTAAEAGASLLG
jgi:hypothetical protein